jgi:hypothetical protein
MGINDAPLELSREKHKTAGGGPVKINDGEVKAYGDYRELRDHNILCPGEKVKTAGWPPSRHFLANFRPTNFINIIKLW